jgi:HK97 family phage major capsid protein
MEDKDFKELIDKFKTESQSFVKNEISQAVKGIITADELQKSLEPLASKEAVEKMVEAVEKQGAKINELINTNQKSVVKSLVDVLKENAQQIETVAKDRKGLVRFKTEITRASVTTGHQGLFLPGVNIMPYQGAVLEPLFAQGSVGAGSNGTIYYTDQTTDTNNAAAKAESAAFGESVAAWTGRSATLEKITDSFPVTWEAMRDLDFMASEVNRLLNTHLVVKVDNYLYSGSGATPVPTGVYTAATTFVPATFLSSYGGVGINFANIYDLIAAMRVTIMNGYSGKYRPDTVLMNPLDVLKLKLTKDADGQYVIPPYSAMGGQFMVDGLKVIESESVTANTCVVGDFRQGTVYTDGGIEIELGYINTQFTEDVATLKARKRMMLLIKTADAGAFYKSTDIAGNVQTITNVGA